MDPCTIRVAKRVEAAMALMKLDDWKRVCESARDAKAATGLSTTMKARPKKRLKP
jgi:hypothetical protein